MPNVSGMLIWQYAYDQARLNPGQEVKIMSERELCKIYDVSRPTVRKILDELVVDGVLLIRKGHGTFTNPTAFKKQYLPGSKLTVGIIVGYGRNVVYDHFFWGMISEAGRVICEENGNVRLIQMVHDNEKIAENILLLNLDALIWVHPKAEQKPAIDDIQGKGIPVMCVNRIFPGSGINYVTTDFYAVGQTVANYFLDKGHQKNLFIVGSLIEPYIELYNGYCSIFAERGIEVDERLLLTDQEAIIDDINNLLRFKIDFTACFAIGNHIWAAIEAIKTDCGDNFREKYAFLTTHSSSSGFRDYPFVNIDSCELGRRAALEVKALATGSQRLPVKIKLKPEVIV